MEIYSNLHWLDGGNSNAYLYLDGDACVLVDLGMPGHIDILGYLQRLGRSPRDVSHILLTHADIDHIGALAALRRLTGATVYASRASAALLRAGAMPSHGFRWFDWVLAQSYQYEPLAVQPVDPGTVLPLLGGLEVIATPGHTADHVAYFSRATGILFSGDALHTRTGALRESGWFISADYPQSRRSAARLLALNPAVVACGHGRPLQNNTPVALHQLHQRLASA